MISHLYNQVIYYVRDFLLPNGKFRNNIFQNLVLKVNYLRVINMVKTALRRYNEIRFSNERCDKVFQPQNNVDKLRSRDFYSQLVKQKSRKASMLNKWNELFGENVDWMIMSTYKIKNQFEVKIEEFNFKKIHNLLPTRSNLHR